MLTVRGHSHPFHSFSLSSIRQSRQVPQILPHRFFLQVRTGSRRSKQGQTPWWIVELRPGAAGQQAAVGSI
jgi:hypothetical protein